MWLQPQDPQVAGVTITAEPQLSDYGDIVGNLTHPGQLRRMVRSMERSTWEASALLRVHMRIDAALTTATREVCGDHDAARTCGRRMCGRICGCAAHMWPSRTA